jgi:hypothetical protein
MRTKEASDYLKNATRSIKDYPKKGIIFRDLTTIFQDSKAMGLALEMLSDCLKDEEENRIHFDKLAGIEARGSPTRNGGSIINWNMAKMRWKFTKMPSNQGKGSLSWTIFWQQGERPKQVANLSNNWEA